MRTVKKIPPVSLALAETLGAFDLAAALRPHMAKAKWAEVVGPQVAGVTQVEAVRGGTTLVVRVKNSVWANELVLLKGDMLRRLNKALGGPVLTDIHFKASGLAKAKKAAPTAPLFVKPASEIVAREKLSAHALARIQKATQDIADDALRATVRRSLLRAAQTDSWKRAQGWRPCTQCGALAPPPEPCCALCRFPASGTPG